MYTKYFVVDHGGECEKIEHTGKVMPYIRRPIFSYTFLVKTVTLRDATTFMVAPDEMNT